jgi:hypothetical protein
MKKSLCLAASLLALNLTPGFGQLTPIPPPPVSSPQLAPARMPRLGTPGATHTIDAMTGQLVDPNNSALTKFNLDFPGGTPKGLVAAIEKAMGRPLNAIIPTEDADLQMPPLKMTDVVAPQLFAALSVASRRTIMVPIGNMPPGHFAQQSTDYGFNTTDGPVTDTSVWYFHAERPSPPSVEAPQKICQFYLLEPYFKHGFTVDDITTAIQTGWKMMGDASPPEISFHKETKLLIAVGERDKLQVIDTVLKALEKSDYKLDLDLAPGVDPNTGLPLSTAKPKAEKSGK